MAPVIMGFAVAWAVRLKDVWVLIAIVHFVPFLSSTLVMDKRQEQM
jgi:hypothetical protein